MAVNEDQQLGLRERKKRKTRADLSLAARRLVRERGLDATTVDDIASAVGVSARTFFNYYDTKTDAVVGPVGEIGTPQSRARFVAGGPSGVLIDDLVALVVSGIESEDDLRESVSLLMDLIDKDPRILAGLVASGMQHEAAIAELLSERLGEQATPGFLSLAPALMITITSRAALASAPDSTDSLADAIREHCAMAARLFAGPDRPEQENSR